jgi:hypothetical protein
LPARAILDLFHFHIVLFPFNPGRAFLKAIAQTSNRNYSVVSERFWRSQKNNQDKENDAKDTVNG